MHDPRRDEIDEGPSAEDIERFGSATVACPKCEAEVYDDAAMCWKCGHALSTPDKPLPGWIILVAMLMIILIVVFWVF